MIPLKKISRIPTIVRAAVCDCTQNNNNVFTIDIKVARVKYIL